MKIENVGQINTLQNTDKVENKTQNTTNKEKPTNADVYEKSKPEDKGHVYDRVTIDQLKKDSEQAYGYLKRIVEDMLRRQGLTMQSLNGNASVKVDDVAKAEAAELISEDGPLGVEAVSNRIVDFAKAISGGDKSKLSTLRNAINEGFKQAEKILGKLPDISQKTYERIMEKLTEWEEE